MQREIEGKKLSKGMHLQYDMKEASRCVTFPLLTQNDVGEPLDKVFGLSLFDSESESGY
jgi:hypothetical protein